MFSNLKIKIQNAEAQFLGETDLTPEELESKDYKFVRRYVRSRAKTNGQESDSLPEWSKNMAKALKMAQSRFKIDYYARGLQWFEVATKIATEHGLTLEPKLYQSQLDACIRHRKSGEREFKEMNKEVHYDRKRKELENYNKRTDVKRATCEEELETAKGRWKFATPLPEI